MLYAKNFDPNTREYIVHVQEVDKAELPSLLLELSRLYFEQLGSENDGLEPLEIVEEEIGVAFTVNKGWLKIIDDEGDKRTFYVFENVDSFIAEVKRELSRFG